MNSIIKLLAVQVPFLWETIKFVATTADEIDKKDLKPYLNELLHSLLSDNAQCFVRMDEKRTLLALMITRILVSKTTGEKYLYIQCLYSFQHVDNSIWEKDMEFIRQFAEKEKCSYISFDSRHRRVQELGESVGFQEVNRNFAIRL